MKGWIRDVYVGYFGRKFGATISWADEDMGHEAWLVELPHQCVLPASSAEYQDTKVHEEVAWWSWQLTSDREKLHGIRR
jgi:hypothetical protein